MSCHRFLSPGPVCGLFRFVGLFLLCVGNIILKLWNVYLSMVAWMDVYFYRRVKI